MTDIICRLRNPPFGTETSERNLFSTAADEIERLRMTIPDDWKPTAENVNALPEPVRKYVYALEMTANPAGMLRDNYLLKHENEMLRTECATLAERVSDLEVELREVYDREDS